MKKTVLLIFIHQTTLLYCQLFKKAANIDSISTYSYQEGYGTHSIDSFTFFSDKYEDFYVQQIYYQNGKIELEAFMINGEYDGPHRHWYPNGKLQHFTNYHNGLPAGFYASWYENGNIETCGSYEEFNPADTIYKDATIRQHFFDCDTFHTVLDVPPYSEETHISCEDNVLKTGKWTEYYEDGQLKSEKYFQHGSKTSTWKYYNHNGTVAREELYENNRLIRKTEK